MEIGYQAGQFFIDKDQKIEKCEDNDEIDQVSNFQEHGRDHSFFIDHERFSKYCCQDEDQYKSGNNDEVKKKLNKMTHGTGLNVADFIHQK